MGPPTKGHAEFIAEASEILDSLAREIGDLAEGSERGVAPDKLNIVFRSAHSLKGLAGMFGQERMSELGHQLEGLLDRLRLGKLQPSKSVFEVLSDAVDVLQLLLAELVRGETYVEVAQRAMEVVGRMEGLANAPPSRAPPPHEELAPTEDSESPGSEADSLGIDPQIWSVLSAYEEHRLRECVRLGQGVFKVRAVLELASFDRSLTALHDALKPLGELIGTLPSAEPATTGGIAFDLILATPKSHAELTEALSGVAVKLTEVAVRRPAPSPPKEAKSPATGGALPPAGAWEPPPSGPRLVTAQEGEAADLGARSGAEGARTRTELETSVRSVSQTVRVDIRRLDLLMNAVGELLLIKANLQRLAATAVQGGAHVVSKLWGQELLRESSVLERRLGELQSGILDVRMVPLGQVLDKLVRLSRRVAREVGKEIDFSVSGEEVELDKLIVEELSDPLMHLIRNAIDHGIEPADEREKKGKPRTGRIELRASHKGNHVLIEVVDDGAGLDEERIREVAVQKGLLTGQQARELGRKEAQNLIFQPGFSTARTVSQLSGRGVGLDVVKTNIANLSGIIDIDSEVGRGTTFSLTLPLTLAIIRALIVSSANRVYAVPLNSVMEIITVEAKDIATVERREVVSLRGQTLPFLRLARVFGYPESPVQRHFVVVVGLAQERLGIAVEELLGQQDIVTKPLGGKLRQVPGIAGASDLGNRRTVLVLDVGALMDEVIHPERLVGFL